MGEMARHQLGGAVWGGRQGHGGRRQRAEGRRPGAGPGRSGPQILRSPGAGCAARHGCWGRVPPCPAGRLGGLLALPFLRQRCWLREHRGARVPPHPVLQEKELPGDRPRHLLPCHQVVRVRLRGEVRTPGRWLPAAPSRARGVLHSPTGPEAALLCCWAAGLLPDVGRPPGARDDEDVRRHRNGPRREVQGLPVPRLHEPHPGLHGGRAVLRPDQAAAPRGAHVQVLLRLPLQHPQQLVPVRGAQVHQLPHPGAGQGLQGDPCDDDGQAGVPQELRVLGVPDGRPHLRGGQHVPAVQRSPPARLHRHHFLGRGPPGRLHRLRQLHLQLAGRPLHLQDVPRADDVRRQRLLLPLHGGLAAGAGRPAGVAALHGPPLGVRGPRRAALGVLGLRPALHLLHHQPVRRRRLHHHHDAPPGLRHPPLLPHLRPHRHRRGRAGRRRRLPGPLPPRLRPQPHEEAQQEAASRRGPRAEGLGSRGPSEPCPPPCLRRGTPLLGGVGVGAGWTSDSLFQLLFPGKGPRPGQAAAAPTLFLCLNGSEASSRGTRGKLPVLLPRPRLVASLQGH